jgi:hypothetical protein
MRSQRLLLLAIALAAVQLLVTSRAFAAQPQNAPNPGPAAGGQTTAPPPVSAKKSNGNGNCSASALILNAANPFSHCNLASQAANGVAQVPGDVAGVAGAAAKGLAGDVMDQVTLWMVQAAQTVDGDVMKAATSTTTPELSAPWYQQEFGYLAFFGAALAAIVALLGVFSAAVRGDPYALGEIFYGILRAAIVTAMVISLTLLALKVADGISGDVAQHMPRQFFQTLASAWGTKGWGGLASSALAFVAALVEVIVAVLLWIELLFRDAAIYVAVLFFPFTVAMAIWPRLSDAHSKLVRILGVFIVFKPAALIVMMTGANLLLGGVSFYGGVGKSVGTILAGLAVLAMAAFAPWALLHLAGLDAGVMGSSSTRRRGGRTGANGISDASATGARGGELFSGTITQGAGAAAGTAAVASGPSSGRDLAARNPVAATAGGNAGSPNSADGGRRILPGPVAAAAGLLPAGWQAAQTVATRAQSLADHGAARVHTAAGHGGAKPMTFSNSAGSVPARGTDVHRRTETWPPPPRPGHDMPLHDSGGSPNRGASRPPMPPGSSDPAGRPPGAPGPDRPSPPDPPFLPRPEGT